MQGPRTMSKVTTQICHQIGATSSQNAQAQEVVVSNCELDSHADTCCLGANFLPIYFTGKVCDVSPFLDTMPIQNDIQVCTGITAMDDGTGNTLILVVNEALWMGDKIQHSLLNPYQIRLNGVQLSDDPTDGNRYFGMQAGNVQVPFKMKGTTCVFQTCTPTPWEIDNCPHIELTSDQQWKPHDILFGLGLEQRENDTGLQPMSTSAYETRHRCSDIDPATLARQWGIGLETARNTLCATTQVGIHHAIHPITRRYW